MVKKSKQLENKTTDTNAVEKVPAEKTEGENAKQESRKETKKKSSTRVKKEKKPVSKIAVFAFFLVLLVGSAAGYEYYLLQIQINQSSKLSRAQTISQTRIDKLEQQLQATRQSLETENNTLKAKMDVVSEKLGRTTTAWRLAEVEYLLTVANHRLNLVHDRKTAITIFETADERLVAIGDPGLMSVRKTIAGELTSLRSISEPDITGMALSLSSLAKDIEKLPLIFKERVDLALGDKQKSKPESWRELPEAIWEEIKGLVVIRRHEQPTEPLLPPAEAWFLQQNLRLKLEEAQLALLRRETSLFRNKLQEARIWIETFFDNDSAAVKNAASTLKSLDQVELEVKLPDVSGSLRELRRLLTQRGVE